MRFGRNAGVFDLCAGRLWLAGFAAVLASASWAQASVDPSLFQDLKWRLIGPFRGGRVLTVDGAPNEPNHFYFGAVNGGVWETGDAGRTWQPIFDNQGVGSIGAIAIAPSDKKTLYVTAREGLYRVLTLAKDPDRLGK